MRAPEPLVALIEQGVIDEVVRPLMSGKEAQVYLVVADGKEQVAKIYKEAKDRTFKHRSEYTEGRRVRNTRDQRAMRKHSSYGRSKEEAAWRTAEVDAIYRLRDAGVRVPEPRAFVDNVLVMELVTDGLGNPAPRLADVPLARENPEELFERLLRDVVKMLCAGLVHGDLSEFNILAGADESVIIDLPQVVDAAANRNARKLLIRDVDNLTRFFDRHVPGLRRTRYGAEIWDLYERGELTPDSVLSGRFRRKGKKTDVASLLAEMDELDRENRPLREVLSVASPAKAKRPRQLVIENPTGKPAGGRAPSRRKGNRKPAAHGAPARSTARGAAQPRPEEAAGPSRRSPSNRGRGRRRPAPDKAPASSGPHDGARQQHDDGAEEQRKAPSRSSRRRRGRRKPAAHREPAGSASHDATQPQRSEATDEQRPSSSRSGRGRGRRKPAPNRAPASPGGRADAQPHDHQASDQQQKPSTSRRRRRRRRSRKGSKKSGTEGSEDR